jgi:uncharacterized protein YoxC
MAILESISENGVVNSIVVDTVEELQITYHIQNTTHSLVGSARQIYESMSKNSDLSQVAKTMQIIFKVPYKKISNNLTQSTTTTLDSTNSLRDSLISMLTSGRELKFTPDQTGIAFFVNVDGKPVETIQNVFGSTITVNFTTARQPYATDWLSNPIVADTTVKKPSFFDKLKKAFQKTCDFRDKAQDKIAVATGYCNNIAAKTNALSQQLNITSNMINSAFDGLSVIAEARQNFTNQLTYLVSSIKNIPNNFNNHLQKLLDSVRGISSVYQTTNADQGNALDTDLLLDISEGISNVPTEDTYETTKYDMFGNAYKAYITTAGNSNNAIQARKNILFLQLLFYIAIIFEVYEKIQNIQTINLIDLERIHSKIMVLYNKIINHPYLDIDLMQTVNEAHAIYQDNFSALQKVATKYVDINVLEPTPLITLISNINNGNNLDFIDETIAINKFTNIFAITDKVRILVNE